MTAGDDLKKQAAFGVNAVQRVLSELHDIDLPKNMTQSWPEDQFETLPPFDFQSSSPPAPISTFHRVSDLFDRYIPPREWLVPDLIPLFTVTMLSGDGGTGKSLIAAQLAVSTCLGSIWMGRSVAQGGAVYISAEDDEDELLRRLASVVRSEDVTFRDLDRLTICSLAGKSALLANLERNGTLRASRLMGEIEAIIEREKPLLVVLDTLADLFPGNENDRSQARQFVGMVRGLAIRFECAVLLLSHPSVEGMRSGSGTSGSTAWKNSVRSQLYFDRVKSDDYEMDVDARILRCMKSNYSRAGAEISVRWRDGTFQPEGVETAIDAQAASARAERVFVQMLRLFNEQGRRVSHQPSNAYAPKMFAQHPDSEGVTQRAFKDVMERLLSSKRIEIIEEGPQSKRRQRLVLVG